MGKLPTIKMTGPIPRPPLVITVSGSDASGGAGMQADNRAILACGAFPLNIVTALTLQTPGGVHSIVDTPVDVIRMHLLGLLKDYDVRAIKTGMLATTEITELMVDVMSQYSHIPLIIDPVIEATSGRPLISKDGFQVLKNELVPMAHLVTPNIPELGQLVEQEILDQMDAARSIIETGCNAVLVKGGHLEGHRSDDVLVAKDRVEVFEENRVQTQNSHGTGCALASGIAAGVAKGLSLSDAVGKAKDLLSKSLNVHKDEDWAGFGPALY